MTEEAEGWKHCGRCGHLFQGLQGGRCPECEGNPVVSEAEMAYITAQSTPVGGGAAPSTPGAAGRPVKKRGSLLKFTIAWMSLLMAIAGIIALARSLGPEKEETATFDIGEATDTYQALNDAYSKCYPVLRTYYSSVAPEVRAPLTLHPSRTLGRMSRWPEELVLAGRNTLIRNRSFTVFETSEGPSVASVWQLENGDRIEAVFRKNADDEWAIDWEQMVRYSSEVWPVFMSGLGEPTGEFRLLARRRANSSLGVGDVSRIIFHPPSTRSAAEYGAGSPEVKVDPASEDGIKLAEAFELRDAGGSAFSAALSNDDPMGMIRVRVKLRLGPKDEHGRLTLVLDEVVACHWMDIDDRARPDSGR